MTTTMNGKRRRAVIVGAGFGGLRLARRLGQLPLDVVLIDKENHHLFQPLLYQVATAGLAPDQIATPIRSVVHAQDNTEVLLGEVIGADPKARCVVMKDGERLPYDWLVVAAGARTSYFGHDAWAEHAGGLKNLRDALTLRERILLAFEAAERESDPTERAHLLTFAVIGGGPTGVELAGAISQLGRLSMAKDFRHIGPDDVRVVLVEMAPRLLGPFDPELAEAAKQQLESSGVEVHLGERVTGVDGQGVRTDQGMIEASTVCWATGVQPVALAGRLGFELDKGQIVVGQDCAVPGHREVFAIGDIARFVPEGEDAPLPGLAPVAMQQADHVARAIHADLDGRERPAFHYRDKGILATIGRSSAVVQTKAFRTAGAFAWLLWILVHIVYLIGFRNRILVLFDWFWSYLTFRRGARLITGRHEPVPEGRRMIGAAPGRPHPATGTGALPGDGAGAEAV